MRKAGRTPLPPGGGVRRVFWSRGRSAIGAWGVACGVWGSDTAVCVCVVAAEDRVCLPEHGRPDLFV